MGLIVAPVLNRKTIGVSLSRPATTMEDKGMGGDKSDIIDILYIAGSGRSGSTVLDQVLSRNWGALSMGEVRHVWERGFAADELCSCGETFHHCSLWGGVAKAMEKEFPLLDGRFVQRAMRAAYRGRGILACLFNKPFKKSTELLAAEHLVALYRAIREKSGCRLLVDSSKDPLYAMMLQRTGHFRIHEVHLVRDPRAVAFSWGTIKPRSEAQGTGDMPVISSISSSLRWLYRNLGSHMLRKAVDSYVMIRYEDFVASPEKHLRYMQNQLGISLDGCDKSDGIADTGDFREHTVAGNPSRFHRGGQTMRLDNRWETGMKTVDRLLVLLMTFPLMIYYGYILRHIAPSCMSPSRDRE